MTSDNIWRRAIPHIETGPGLSHREVGPTWEDTRLRDACILFTDTETTGLLGERGARVVEVGVCLVTGLEVAETTGCMVEGASQRALDQTAPIHGIAWEDYREHAYPVEIAHEKMFYCRCWQTTQVDGMPVFGAFNAPFDHGMLATLGWSWPIENWIDPMELARFEGLPTPGDRYTLDAVCEALGVERPSPHCAATDARACALAWIALVKRYGWENEPIVEHLARVDAAAERSRVMREERRRAEREESAARELARAKREERARKRERAREERARERERAEEERLVIERIEHPRRVANEIVRTLGVAVQAARSASPLRMPAHEVRACVEIVARGWPATKWLAWAAEHAAEDDTWVDVSELMELPYDS